MRSITEIKTSMTDAFMADTTVRSLYGLAEGDRFGEKFSAVSFENILFSVVASCVYVVESLFNRHRQEVDEIAERASVASIPWYHDKVMAYQHGDALVLNEETMAYGYEDVAPERQVVKYAAVRDMGNWLKIMASGDQNGRPVKLTDEQLDGLAEYVDRVKIAGVMTSVVSADADRIQIAAQVVVDPLVLRTDGSRITDGSFPVREAVESYLAGIVYGGKLNKTKLVDAMQEATGVVDVMLTSVKWSTDGGNTFHEVAGNNYEALGGCFAASGLENTLGYVVES